MRPDALRFVAAHHHAAHQGRDVIVRVIEVPGPVVDALPLLLRHDRVTGADVLQIVNVHVRVHGDASCVEVLVVLRARQWRQAEELQDVDRQLLLDDLDVVGDLLRRVVGETQDVTGVRDDLIVAPFLEHLAVFGDSVLALLGGHQVVRIDVLQTDENARHAGPLGLGDEILDLVAQGVDLDDDREGQVQLLPEIAEPVENRFPVPVAREVVVGDEKAADTLSDIGAD